jgi:transcriptional regulator with XRE-family HTH domain
MEVGNKAGEYISKLLKTGNFSYEDAANLCGLPAQTIRNIATGKTPDPRFATLAKIVLSLGGDLNELIGTEKQKEIEVNSMVSLKETYEMRIADIIKSYEERIEDIKSLCERRIADIRQIYKEIIAEQREMLSK